MFLFGEIRYLDVYSSSRFTRFRLSAKSVDYESAGVFSFCAYGNEAD